MKILITGSAGFIGFSFAKKLLEKKIYKIVGIDNFNDYYDINLKKKRNNILKNYKNYKFNKADITDKKKLKKFLKMRNLILFSILQHKLVLDIQLIFRASIWKVI